jgi:hypothetical protein
MVCSIGFMFFNVIADSDVFISTPLLLDCAAKGDVFPNNFFKGEASCVFAKLAFVYPKPKLFTVAFVIR